MQIQLSYIDNALTLDATLMNVHCTAYTVYPTFSKLFSEDFQKDLRQVRVSSRMAATILVDVTQFLVNAQALDASVRTAAEEQLKLFQEQNLPGFLASLAAELANNAKPADSRRLAGLILKNTLDAKEDVRKRELHARWLTLDPQLKQGVRDSVLSTLHSDIPDVRHTAAMVTAKISAIDLVRKEWPTLIQTLLGYIGAQPPVTGTRQATLEAMGYVCEEMALVKEEVLSPAEVNMILTAVVAGMSPSEPNESRLAATTALCNAIEFASHNFENDSVSQSSQKYL